MDKYILCCDWGTTSFRLRLVERQDYNVLAEFLSKDGVAATFKAWKEQNPIRYAEQFKTPMLVTIGEQDFRVPLNNAIETWNTLQRLQIPSKLLVFPEENHWILKPENSRFFYSEVHNWLKTYLK